AIQPGGASCAILWRQSLEGAWEPVGEVPPNDKRDAGSIEQRQELLADVSTDEQPRIVSSLSGSNLAGSNGSTAEGSHVLSPIRHAGQTVGILETAHGLDAAGQLPPDTIQFFAALCEITADFLSQHELQQLRRARSLWQQWDQYAHRLWQSLDLASVSAAIANDGRLLAECDRVSVLVRRGRSFQLKSVSGVERVEPRSSATRSLESLARLVARQGRSVWRGATDSTTGEGSDAQLDEILQRHVRDSGATGVGIVPVLAKRDEQDRSPPSAVIVFEHFQPLDDLAGWQSRGESLANRSGLTLRAALERSDIPWLGLWQRVQRLPQLMLRPSTLFVLALLAGIVAALVLIPAEFTVTGPAELWPAQRREVFASTSGIVDQILVAHGDDVKQDQPLLVLRDPELETESPRIIGEIATVNERLKGVQAARFTGGNTPDAASRARQLTADEEELKERLRTLERQRLLIEERRAGLTLRSPIAGKVLTWDVAQHLSARPVERGQSLLTIGETSGPWVVEVRVADKDAGHMLRARKALLPELDVEFLLASEPGRTYRGQVREVSLSSEADDASRSHVRVVVAFDRDQIEQPRPGATALPRIRCGQQPLGYVWLHDLIDAIRTRLLF
ncbi:MAG: HlyD family efflux transporter periplasmic adaptor subunit, partial [Candidatus Saccharimonas sp.]|nr:HlyD family efflux transporter periplasmic adaptor subunit [Planctomycetaceae bacterium]